MTEKLPYVLFESPPLGPAAKRALSLAKYEPTAIISDPKMPQEQMLSIIEQARPSFLLVTGFGALLKQEVLDTVAGQVLNIHPSLLPLYRGPAPIVQTILDGATETGVSLMEIDRKMDHGMILAQEGLPLRGNEYPEELYEVLTTKGIHLFLTHIEEYLNEELEMLPQDHSEATFTHFVKKTDGLLDFSEPAEVLERQVRAYSRWPRAYISIQGKRLIVDAARIFEGKLELVTVQPEGGKVMPFAEYLRGQRTTKEVFMQQLLNTVHSS